MRSDRARHGPRPSRVAFHLRHLCLLAACVAPASLPAQQQGSAGLEGGLSRSLPPSGGTGTAASYLFAGGWIRHEAAPAAALGARLHGGLSAEGEGGDWVSGGVGLELGTGGRRGVGWGLDLGGQGFAVGEPLPYRAAMATAEPELRWVGGGWRLSLTGFGAAGRSRVELGSDTTDFVPPPFRSLELAPQVPPGTPPGGGDGETETERTADLWGVGGGAEVAVETGPATVRLAALHRETSVGTYRAGRVGAGGTAGRFSWSGEVAVWDTPQGTEPAAYLGVSVPLTGGFHAFAAGGRSRPSPVLGSPPVGEASAGVSWRTALGSLPEPLYRVGEEPATGGRRSVTLRLEEPDADSVTVLGDFTRWEPVELTGSGDVWSVTLQVEPGVHHFGFRVDGRWHVPEAAGATVTDEWGRTNAVMVVPGE